MQTSSSHSKLRSGPSKPFQVAIAKRHHESERIPVPALRMFTAVDLSKLPLPDIIEQLDYELILEELLAELVARYPEFSVPADTDPVHKILQVFAYRETTLRQAFNDRAKGCLLATAQNADLDNLGALFDVPRLVLDPGDPATGVPPVMESNTDYRRRIHLAPEGFSVAGPEGAYIYHTLSANPDVLDASATSPLPGEVVVTVLSRLANGMPSAELIEMVNQALSSEAVRPLTDHVIVQAASIIDYQVDATIYTYSGPDAAVVLAEARRRLLQYVDDARRLGRDIPLSALYSMLHVEGVQRVELQAPRADLVLDRTQAAHCTDIVIRHGGNDE
jgi:phage-related baseplate assembly protein